MIRILNGRPREPHPNATRVARRARHGRPARRTWLARTHSTLQYEGDAPWWAGQHHSDLRFWTGLNARRLVLFQKEHLMNEFLPDGRGSDWATRWHIATGTAPFAPKEHDVALLRAHVRLVGGPIGLLGDLDPHGLHTLGALRSGNLDAPSLGGTR